MPYRLRVLIRLLALVLTCAAARDARAVEPMLPESLIVDRIGTERGLPSQAVSALLVDRAGFLWVGTTTGGLALLDRATGRFTRFRHDPADGATLSNNSIFVLLQDQRRQLWAGTHRGLNRLDPAAGRVERFLHDPAKPDSFPGEWVTDIHEDRDGNLLPFVIPRLAGSDRNLRVLWTPRWTTGSLSSLTFRSCSSEHLPA